MANLKSYFQKNLSIDDLAREFQDIDRDYRATGDPDAALIAYRILSCRILKTPRWGEGELIDLDEESMAA